MAPIESKSTDKNASRMQRRLRKAISDFALSQLGGDDLMVVSGVMTETCAATIELLNAYGFMPTEEQFVEMWSRQAKIVAQGKHFIGVHETSGEA